MMCLFSSHSYLSVIFSCALVNTGMYGLYFFCASISPYRAHSPLHRRTAYLPGKVVWITGASSGLGEQLAISAAAGGAAGLILSGRREDALERVKRACEETAKCSQGSRRSEKEAGIRVEVLPFDIADLEFAEKEAASRAARLFGGVDALVLNAGVGVT